MIVDLNLKNVLKSLPAGAIRAYYSELLRIESYGFDLYQSKKLNLDTLKFSFNNDIHRLSYIKTRRYLQRT